MKLGRKLWIGLIVLVVLTPLGVLVPRALHVGTAWGEWSPQEIKARTGSVPAGMARQAQTYQAPLPGYARPGKAPKSPVGQSVWTIVSAAVGVGVVVVLALLLGRLLARNERETTGVDERR